jgi:CRP-like cAMP-binding protein
MRESDYLKAEADVLARLARLPIFDTLDDAGRRAVVNLCKIKRYDAGETIVAQGMLDQWVFLLLSGSVSVRRDGVEINRLSRCGDVFGEMGVVEAAPRSATVAAATPALCLSLDGSVMDRFDPEQRMVFEAVFHKVAAEGLSARLRQAGDELSRRMAEIKGLEADLAGASTRLRDLEERHGGV